MKYFLDTEFLEGTQKTFFGTSKPTIDLISIGIVAEDGREYYAISKDFNLKEAWNRWQQRTGEGDRNNIEPRLYWIRENVLRPLFKDLRNMQNRDIDKMNQLRVSHSEKWLTGDEFSFAILKKLIKKYGKSKKQIAEGIIEFTHKEIFDKFKGAEKEFHQRTKDYGWSLKDTIEFYGYYSDYDWVVFCWIFGKMISLPKAFPMYCIDLKQTIDERTAKMFSGNMESPFVDCNGEKIYNKMFIKGLSKHQGCSEVFYDANFWQPFSYLSAKDGLEFEIIKKLKEHPEYPKQSNEHNALADADWNYKLFKFLETVVVYPFC